MWRGFYFLLLGTSSVAAPITTAAAAGPYHVEAARILDAKGHEYLIRGTELPAATLKISDIEGDAVQFGPFSASAFATLRHRMNMNAVRLPVDGSMYVQSAEYRSRVAKIVRQANRFDLLVILAEDGDAPGFWTRCALEFKNHPNVFFEGIVDAIRAAGAPQPVIVHGLDRIGDPNVIYEFSGDAKTAPAVPLLANDLDPQLDRNAKECAAFPSDPAEATRLIQGALADFDARHISWIISSFRPGRLITDYRYFNWTKLDDGWTCGQSPNSAGIAMVVLGHMWAADPHGLFSVHHLTGSFVLAKGGLSTVYGPILADREMVADESNPPTILGNVSVRLTDSRGAARLAPLLYTGAGWAFLTFVIPPQTATGPAEVAVVRSDGSVSRTNVVIADFAPGLFTTPNDGRGPVVGVVTQRFSTGETKAFRASQCSESGCRTIPIPLSKGVSTQVRLEGLGFRYMGPHPQIRVMIGDVSVPVLSYGPASTVAHDQVTVEIPAELRGIGETDVVMSVNGVLSNVARIRVE